MPHATPRPKPRITEGGRQRPKPDSQPNGVGRTAIRPKGEWFMMRFLRRQPGEEIPRHGLRRRQDQKHEATDKTGRAARALGQCGHCDQHRRYGRQPFIVCLVFRPHVHVRGPSPTVGIVRPTVGEVNKIAGNFFDGCGGVVWRARLAAADARACHYSCGCVGAPSRPLWPAGHLLEAGQSHMAAQPPHRPFGPPLPHVVGERRGAKSEALAPLLYPFEGERWRAQRAGEGVRATIGKCGVTAPPCR